MQEYPQPHCMSLVFWIERVKVQTLKKAIPLFQLRASVASSFQALLSNSIELSLSFAFKDYVLLVPLSSFSPSLLDIKPIDVTQDFIQDCGQHDFYLKESSSKFCLQSAFTITSRFNNGALACNCDTLGSTKISCQSFGGQCACRPNVIGRACDRCTSGYGGFPNCRKLASWRLVVYVKNWDSEKVHYTCTS